jgi:hypothetical protein
MIKVLEKIKNIGSQAYLEKNQVQVTCQSKVTSLKC